ncbi:tyrosine-type recombinase/integrase [Streptomyces sp. NPDC088258]|uniref:tyrosine-type recombinase/integrase n=1 Tax=Streptomyces sp. NPDC088258 TaxID=3365849 RepID=UPI003802EB71
MGICYADYLHGRSAVPQADYIDQVLVNLFREPLGQPMTHSGAKGLFDRLAQRADLIARPHMIRHSAATEWVRQDTDRSVVSDLLGHVSESSMAPYVHVDECSRRAAVEPRSSRDRAAIEPRNVQPTTMPGLRHRLCQRPRSSPRGWPAPPPPAVTAGGRFGSLWAG